MTNLEREKYLLMIFAFSTANLPALTTKDQGSTSDVGMTGFFWSCDAGPGSHIAIPGCQIDRLTQTDIEISEYCLVDRQMGRAGNAGPGSDITRGKGAAVLDLRRGTGVPHRNLKLAD